MADINLFQGKTVRVGVICNDEDPSHLNIAELRVDRIRELPDGGLAVTQIDGPETSFTAIVLPERGTIEVVHEGGKTTSERIRESMLIRFQER